MSSEKIYIKVGLTAEEYAILKELSELEGKPMSSYFMDFVRKGKMFKTLGKVLKALKVVVKIKNSFGSSVERDERLEN